MQYEFRADISVRARGKTPMDFSELKSENYESLEEWAEEAKQFLLLNAKDFMEGYEDEDDEPNLDE